MYCKSFKATAQVDQMTETRQKSDLKNLGSWLIMPAKVWQILDVKLFHWDDKQQSQAQSDRWY